MSNSCREEYDRALHQTLSKIFRERRLSASQIKAFLRGTRQNTDHESIIRSIIRQEPVLSMRFSEKKLRKLSLLWVAVLAGYKDSAELLVRSGADVNEPFGRHRPQMIDEKQTILHVLLWKQLFPGENERLIRLVVDHGADLQPQDCKGRTVLHYSVERELSVQITELLLENGADVNAADADGETPLFLAVSSRKAYKLVSLLIKHGADVLAKDKSYRNALHHLVDNCSNTEQAAKVAKILIENGVPLDDIDNMRFQPIHRAVVSEKHELIEIFVDHGANVNAAVSVIEFSPLYLAAGWNKEAAVMKTLIKRGANLDQRTIAGRTPLHAVCVPGDHVLSFCDEKSSLIRLLLSAGADVLAEDYKGNTPFALLNLENIRNPSIELMIKALALKKVCQSSLELKDEKIIERHPDLWKYYHECFEEIDWMKSTKFIETCTFFELLTRSHCQIAEFMRNPDFETKFGESHLVEFFIYADDIKRAFDRAQSHYHAILEQEDIVNEATYHMLPYIVVRRIVHHIFNYCEDKK